MRIYMTEEYKDNLVGKVFNSSDSDLKAYDGLKVSAILKELTETDYDREVVDETYMNEKGQFRYLINTMYLIKLENGVVINVYEDEINPDYCGSWTE